jgi:limonene-1,2-epoxide hydrolase
MANHSNTNSTTETVLSFIDALNREDFKTARNYLSDDMKFIGVLGTRDNADAYIADMGKMKFKYNIQKVFSDENDVCLFYDITMSGLKIFSCGWYKLENNKIKSFKVIFDPRPLLEQSAKD